MSSHSSQLATPLSRPPNPLLRMLHSALPYFTENLTFWPHSKNLRLPDPCPTVLPPFLHSHTLAPSLHAFGHPSLVAESEFDETVSPEEETTTLELLDLTGRPVRRHAFSSLPFVHSSPAPLHVSQLQSGSVP